MSFLPQNSFYRTPRYSGGMNVPGAPGNLAADPAVVELAQLLASNASEVTR